MVAEVMSRSFASVTNYSHCPLKKRPVTLVLSENYSMTKDSEKKIEIVDEIFEPENLCTKPQDLSTKSSKRARTPSPERPTNQSLCGCQQVRDESPSSTSLAMRPLSPTVRYEADYNQNQYQHLDHHQQHSHFSPVQGDTSPVVSAYPVAKKARVEVIQHDNGISSTMPGDALHYIGAKMPRDMLNLGGPELSSYPNWGSPPLCTPHFFSYHPAYRYHSANMYPPYPVVSLPHSPSEHPPVPSSSPHSVLTCSTIQRPIPRSGHWTNPDHCGLSPTSSLGSGSGSLQSPQPVTPEDLSSPGSESGRSSAGSTSVGPTVVKMEANSESPTFANSSTTRYRCPDCGKSYSTYSGLSKHQQYHCSSAMGQAKKSFTCKYCEKVYVSLGALKMHIRTHTLPCKCHMCGKAFSRPWLLQGHIRTHTGEKPFSCQHCNRAFADRSNLRAHLQTHSDVKKYSCTSCSKTFSRMSLLTKHQEGGCPGGTVSMGYSC